ncbi:TetR/AcrR family transcriptional regulator [Dactylosporangium sp. NPDC005572]|uniref:TetR/AcrR family transcriptional regulator n=1 Tax=Dactylosporangium sp. NPDC005572 TaxID=3156889 RepID=UPI0033AC84F1
MASTSDRPYHHGDLRTALLGQARALLNRDGPEAISFRAIARSAGVSAAAPYNHFPSRRDLLAALAADGFTDLAARQEQAARDTPPGRARFVALGHAYLEFAVEQPQVYRLMFGIGAQNWHDVPLVATVKGASIRPLREAIATHFDDPARAEIAVISTWSTVHGLAMLLIDGTLDQAREGLTGTDLAGAAIRWFIEQSLSA